MDKPHFKPAPVPKNAPEPRQAIAGKASGLYWCPHPDCHAKWEWTFHPDFAKPEWMGGDPDMLKFRLSQIEGRIRAHEQERHGFPQAK
jgi:hypothetical protein